MSKWRFGAVTRGLAVGMSAAAMLCALAACRGEGDRSDGAEVTDAGGDSGTGTQPERKPGVCGDGEVGLGEVCEGTELLCSDFGYATGTAICASDCKSLDLSGCCGRPCGNGVLDEGEVCDRGQESCAKLGGGEGFAPCLADCSGYLEEVCHTPSTTCGDGVRQEGELCDSTPAACSRLGYQSGLAWCNDKCLGYDTSTCCGDAAVLCGNGVLDKPQEACDGDEVDCTELGFATGAARCLDDCSGYDYSECCGGGGCGNGLLDPGELCEVGKLYDCNELGMGTGTAFCLPDCSGYIALYCTDAPPVVGCGDGEVGPDEVCDGGQKSCVELGYESGYVKCKDDCSGYEVEQCTGCSQEEQAAACDGRECGSGDCGVNCGTCPSVEPCVDGQCQPACGNCGEPGARRCSADGGVETCVKVSGDCWEWRAWEDCYGKVCQAGYCVPKTPCNPGNVEVVECGVCMHNTYTCKADGSWSTTGCQVYGCTPGEERCSADKASVEHCKDNCEWTVWSPCAGTEFCWSILLSDEGEKIGEGNCVYPHDCADDGTKEVTCQGGYCEYNEGWGEYTCHPYPKTEPCHRTMEGNGCGPAMVCHDGECIEKCPGGFLCDYFQCIAAAQACDGVLDCDNESDELGCGDCSEELYRCPDGTCRPYWQYCTNPPGATPFRCGDGTPLDLCQVCDGTDDCADDIDEASFFCRTPYTSVK